MRSTSEHESGSPARLMTLTEGGTPFRRNNSVSADGTVFTSVTPADASAGNCSAFSARMTFPPRLKGTNNSKTDEFVFENCLHTYFEVGDITTVSISGLKGVNYLDKVANFAQKTENEEVIRITSEIDRIYLDTTGTVEIVDARLGRKILVEKQASLSTVVWNPWIAKAQQMPDFGNEEYECMACVESGNVASNQIRLPPGESSRLTVKLSTCQSDG